MGNKFTFFRYCKRCDKDFHPHYKNQKICYSCMNSKRYIKTSLTLKAKREKLKLDKFWNDFNNMVYNRKI